VTFYCQDTDMSTDSEPQSYTIADLARLADVTPRTVRYYVAQGLLPSPGTLGPGSRYGAGHLARLRLVRRLQRRHLPLAEIRRRLAALSDRDVESALREPEPSPPASDTASTALAYIHSVLGEPRPSSKRPAWPIKPPIEHPRFAVHAALRRGEVPAMGLTAAEPPTLAIAESPTLGTQLPPPGVPPHIPDRSQWDRISLVPDIELHVRRPSSRHLNKRIDRLVAVARELLEEDQP
jgi:DNA-binding transcriptional MerR regulator